MHIGSSQYDQCEWDPYIKEHMSEYNIYVLYIERDAGLEKGSRTQNSST